MASPFRLLIGGAAVVGALLYYNESAAATDADTDDDDDVIEGCTDATATNYDSTATTDDGSCEYAEPEADDDGGDDDDDEEFIDPRDRDESADFVTHDGDVIEVEHPLFTEETELGKLYRDYGISFRVVMDSSGRSAESSQTAPPIIVDFEVDIPNWVAERGNRLTVTRLVPFPPPDWDDWLASNGPTWSELFTALGGQRTDGPYIGPQVTALGDQKTLLNGEVKVAVHEGDRSGVWVHLSINPADNGAPNPAFKLVKSIRCPDSSNWIESTPMALTGQVERVNNVPMFVIAGLDNMLTIPSSDCFYPVKDVVPPATLRVWTGGRDSAGGYVFETWELQGNPEDYRRDLELNTEAKAVLWREFYNQSRPAAILQSGSNDLVVRANFVDEDSITAAIPEPYAAPTYTCTCPSGTQKEGQTVEMPLECSNYTGGAVSLARQQELRAACGGLKSSGGTRLGGGRTSMAETFTAQSYVTPWW